MIIVYDTLTNYINHSNKNIQIILFLKHINIECNFPVIIMDIKEIISPM